MNLLARLFYPSWLTVPACMLLALMTGCNNYPEAKVPAGARLVAKYKVLDEERSPSHTKCGGIAEEFIKAGPYTCSFKVEGLEFDIEDKYVIDSTGHLREFHTFLAEGPVIYSLKELAADSAYIRYKNLENFHVAFVSNFQSILDGDDTLAIERIFPAEKLIMARKSAKLMPGRRFIYQFRE